MRLKWWLMMSENRFTINLEDECIDDAEERIFISFLDRIDFYELCAFLNEQQATISDLKEENEQLRKKLEQIYSFKGLNCRCVNGV